MRLYRIRKVKWEVLAIRNDRGDCQPLDFLAEHMRDSTVRQACIQLLAMLKETIPVSGPPLHAPLTKSLKNGLFEFRKQPHGKKVRLSWFFDGDKLVVCALGFTKKSTSESDPRNAIEKSRKLQKLYFSAKKIPGAIQIEDLKEEGDEQG